MTGDATAPCGTPPYRKSDFSFDLPERLIAQAPAASRGASRLLVLDGSAGSVEDRQFADLPSLLRRGDLLVRNDTRVLPARVHGRKATGGAVEVLVERLVSVRRVNAHVRASKGARLGHVIEFPGGAVATVVGREENLAVLEFDRPVADYLEDHGHTVINPKLPDDDFAEAVRIAQVEFDKYQPQVVVGSSRGGAVAMNINSGSAKLVLLCPAWKNWGTARTVKPGTVILHSRADDVIPFAAIGDSAHCA